jgi:folate-binding protein YgfZ
VTVPGDVDLLDASALEDARIRAGWPAMGNELTEGITPAMTGIVAETVSFEKGCYTGQELVARVHHRGAEPVKSLVKVVAPNGTNLARGDELTVEGEAVGTVTSVTHGGLDGLGYVKRGTVVPGPADIGAAVVELSHP